MLDELQKYTNRYVKYSTDYSITKHMARGTETSWVITNSEPPVQCAVEARGNHFMRAKGPGCETNNSLPCTEQKVKACSKEEKQLHQLLLLLQMKSAPTAHTISRTYALDAFVQL
jgi:hypothetical protein